MRTQTSRDVELAYARERDVLAAVYARDVDQMSELMSAAGFAVDATLGCVTQQTCMERIVALEDGAGFDIDDLQVLHADDRTVVVVYRLRQHGTFEGAALPPLVYSTSVWSGGEGSWKAVFHHETVASSAAAGDTPQADPALSATAFRTIGPAASEVLDRERRLVAAAGRDETTFAQMVSPDVVYIGPDGCTGSAELASALAHFPGDVPQPTAFRVLELAPNAVVVTYHIRPTVDDDRASVYCSSVWLAEPDGRQAIWQVICHQQAPSNQ